MKLKIFTSNREEFRYICKLGNQFANGWNINRRLYKINGNEPHTLYYRQLLNTIAHEYELVNRQASVHDNLSTCLRGMTNRTLGREDYTITVFKLNKDCTEIREVLEVPSYGIKSFLTLRGLPYYA